MKPLIFTICALFVSSGFAADPRGYTGKYGKIIYKEVNEIAGNQCEVESCTTALDQVKCSWSNGENVKDFECDFMKNEKVAGKLKGAEAKKLVSMFQKYGKVESDTMKDRAGFSQAQKVSCRETKTPDAKEKVSSSCTFSTAGRAPDSVPDAAPADSPAPTGEKLDF